jgi:hypothetical protein
MGARVYERVFVKYFHFTDIFIPGVGESVLNPSKSENPSSWGWENPGNF